jgi:hypothetical protein
VVNWMQEKCFEGKNEVVGHEGRYFRLYVLGACVV